MTTDHLSDCPGQALEYDALAPALAHEYDESTRPPHRYKIIARIPAVGWDLAHRSLSIASTDGLEIWKDRSSRSRRPQYYLSLGPQQHPPLGTARSHRMPAQQIYNKRNRTSLVVRNRSTGNHDQYAPPPQLILRSPPPSPPVLGHTLHNTGARGT